MTTIGIQFIDTNGGIYDPHGDDRHAAWIERTYGPADRRIAEFAELRAALADQPNWMRHRRSGYASHAVAVRKGHTAVVIGTPTGWAWQVYRTGGSRPVRDIRDTSAATAAEAMRLADEFIDRRRTARR
ncbi:hypothetical protein ABZ949_02220 [Micromonospora tulbaghiae]|uniref:hypothetical protein n=1 Tax=Micromonospora tulbaghiae TaxID=479978 RepID=UPI0033F18195